MNNSTVTLEEFCDRLIKYRQGNEQDALRNYFQLLGQKDRDACHIAERYTSEDVEMEFTHAAERYRGS